MKKLLVCMFALCLLAVPCWGAEYWNEGHSGDSWDDAYVIDSLEDFLNMRERNTYNTQYTGETGKYYKLDADLVITYDDFSYGVAIDYFTGHFDGQNHTINVSIETEEDKWFPVPLFGGINTSGSDPALRNLNVTGKISAHMPVSIISELYQGIVENCSFTGTIKAKGESGSIGGIVGSMGREGNSSIIRNCRVKATITTDSLGDHAGGIAGLMNIGNCIIEDCTAESGTDIYTAGGAAGGIAGWANTQVVPFSSSQFIIRNCTSNANLDGAGYRGGILGNLNNADTEHAKDGLTLSGNTWPSQYPQVGSDTDPADTNNPDNPDTPDNPEDNPNNPDNPDTPSNPGIGGGGSGGGCSAGFGILALAGVLLIAKKR